MPMQLPPFMGGPQGAPPMPGLGGPRPLHSYPPQPGQQDNRKPGAKDWNAGFATEAEPGAKPKGRPGDWICPACKNINFSSRKICHNDKCKGTAQGAERIGLKPGDWICPNCGDLVFASKSKCKMCHTPKMVGGEPAPAPPMQPGGDWLCPACGDHQFAKNMECRLCRTERPIPDWTCANCGDTQTGKNANCRQCGDPQPAPQKGKGKGWKGGGKCKKGMNEPAFDPTNPIESINSMAANFDPNYNPNDVNMAPVDQLAALQGQWMNQQSSAPAPAPAPALNPAMVMNWNTTEEDKWARDGWTEKPKWTDKSGGSSGWQDNLPESEWGATGWKEGKAGWLQSGWQEPS